MAFSMVDVLCVGGVVIYKVWILSVIGGTMNHVIFLLAAADTHLCRPMRLKIWNQNPKNKGVHWVGGWLVYKLTPLRAPRANGQRGVPFSPNCPTRSYLKLPKASQKLRTASFPLSQLGWRRLSIPINATDWVDIFMTLFGTTNSKIGKLSPLSCLLLQLLVFLSY